jgi:hypothetical protein
MSRPVFIAALVAVALIAFVAGTAVAHAAATPVEAPAHRASAGLIAGVVGATVLAFGIAAGLLRPRD